MSTITAVRMPKWGLSMQEGKVVAWLKGVGERVAEGEELVDVETSKITNVCEAPGAGVLRRVVAGEGEVLPVGALLGVLAEADTPDAEIDAFVAAFDPGEGVEAGEAGPALRFRRIEAASLTLRVASAGEGGAGAPALLLHGFGGDLDNWQLVMEGLAADRPVFALDLPGHGESDKRAPDPSPTGLARVILAAMDALSLERAHLVGHSLGAAIALALAAEAPARVLSLSLVAPAGLGDLNADYIKGFLEARRAKDMQAVARLLFHDAEMATRELAETLVKAKRLDGVEETLAAIAASLLGDGLSRTPGDLAAAQAPVLIVLGASDQVAGAPAASPAGVRVETLQGAGHMPHLEQASAVSALVRAHLG